MTRRAQALSERQATSGATQFPLCRRPCRDRTTGRFAQWVRTRVSPTRCRLQVAEHHGGHKATLLADQPAPHVVRRRRVVRVRATIHRSGCLFRVSLTLAKSRRSRITRARSTSGRPVRRFDEHGPSRKLATRPKECERGSPVSRQRRPTSRRGETSLRSHETRLTCG